MIQELIYTSSPHGLKPDSSGFCTVACTEGMATNLQSELERLSGYRHLAEPNTKLTPNVLMHTIRLVGGAKFHILSRVATCAEDYTGRTNKIAHHLALDSRELQRGGPAAILLADENQSIFRKEWNETPDTIKVAKRLPNVNYPPQKCVSWERVFGDAGYAGLASQAAEEGRPISLIFSPGIAVSPIQLITEALALLPPSVRWDVSFSSYFLKTQENDKAKVQWKCILAKSEEMAVSRLTPTTLYMDLANVADFKARNPLSGKYIDEARGVQRGTISVEMDDHDVHSAKPDGVPWADTSDVPYDIDERDIIPSATGGQRRRRIPVQIPSHKKLHFGVWWTVLSLLLVLSVIGFGIARNNRNVKTNVDTIQNEAPRNDEEEENADPEKKEQEHIAEPEAEKADAEKFEQERLAAEAENAEQERIAAAVAKAAAKKEEAEKAEAKKKEQERIAVILKDLPSDYWQNSDEDRGIFMRQESSGLGKIPGSILKNSRVLWEHQDRVQLELIPYVLQEKDKDGKRIGFIYVGENGKHKITFCVDSKSAVGEVTTLTIATIELTEEGVKFEWAENIAFPTNDYLNRALLSFLTITVDDHTEEIPLYEPIVQIAGPAAPLPTLDKSYHLWRRESGDRPVFVSQENERLTFYMDPLDGKFGEQGKFVVSNINDQTITFKDSTSGDNDVVATLAIKSQGEGTGQFQITATFEERKTLATKLAAVLKNFEKTLGENKYFGLDKNKKWNLRDADDHQKILQAIESRRTEIQQEIADNKDKKNEPLQTQLQQKKAHIDKIRSEVTQIPLDIARQKVIDGIENSLKTVQLPIRVYLLYPTDKNRKLLLLEGKLK